MALDTTLGGAAADSYATLAEAEAYAAARLYVDEWTAADDATKEAALKQATRMNDTLQYKGYKSTGEQALQWPRIDVLDYQGWLVPSDSIPKAVKDAQCEMAILLLKEDRADDGGVAPINSVRIGSLAVDYDTGQNRKAIPDSVRNLLANLTTSTMTAKLVRA